MVTSGGPASLTFTITDANGKIAVPAVSAARHAAGLPRPYWPLMLSLAQPGVYTATAELGSSRPTAAFTVSPAAAVKVPQPGDRMIPVDTPTTADAAA